MQLVRIYVNFLLSSHRRLDMKLIQIRSYCRVAAHYVVVFICSSIRSNDHKCNITVYNAHFLNRLLLQLSKYTYIFQNLHHRDNIG